MVLLNRKDPAKPRFIVLGSTDPELNGHKLLDLYAARFQIEFLFRDSKQFTRLQDCIVSWEQCQGNERLLDLFIEKFALDLTWVKNHSCYNELRTYGAIAAWFLSGPLS